MEAAQIYALSAEQIQGAVHAETQSHAEERRRVALELEREAQILIQEAVKKR
jgi:tRNA threonylcarbamoyladenosine modification (KEOPS) complex  Pcc1 subunit